MPYYVPMSECLLVFFFLVVQEYLMQFPLQKYKLHEGRDFVFLSPYCCILSF